MPKNTLLLFVPLPVQFTSGIWQQRPLFHLFCRKRHRFPNAQRAHQHWSRENVAIKEKQNVFNQLNLTYNQSREQVAMFYSTKKEKVFSYFYSSVFVCILKYLHIYISPYLILRIKNLSIKRQITNPRPKATIGRVPNFAIYFYNSLFCFDSLIVQAVFPPGPKYIFLYIFFLSSTEAMFW